jgi:hypothetical protein
MATLDPNDDNIKRYVVRRYAYDHECHELRHQVVAAFDNEREFIALIRARKREVDLHRSSGEEPLPSTTSPVSLEPGYLRAWTS